MAFETNSEKMDDIRFDPVIELSLRQKKKERNGLCVLIVQDQVSIRQMFVEALRLRWNYETIVARNANKTIKLYLENAPDLVILDMESTLYDGNQVLAKLKEIDRDAFVILTGANASHEKVQQSIAIGAAGFITKPFTKSKIEGYINTYIEKYQESKTASK